MSRETIKSLIDLVPEEETETLYKVILKFIPSDVPTADEIEAIRIGKLEEARGEIMNLQDINWD